MSSARPARDRAAAVSVSPDDGKTHDSLNFALANFARNFDLLLATSTYFGAPVRPAMRPVADGDRRLIMSSPGS